MCLWLRWSMNSSEEQDENVDNLHAQIKTFCWSLRSWHEFIMCLPVHSYLSGKHIRHSPSMFSYLLSPMLFFLKFCQNIKLQHKNTVTENVFVVGFGLWHIVRLLYDIYSLGHWKLKRIFWHSSKFKDIESKIITRLLLVLLSTFALPVFVYTSMHMYL